MRNLNKIIALTIITVATFGGVVKHQYHRVNDQAIHCNVKVASGTPAEKDNMSIANMLMLKFM